MKDTNLVSLNEVVHFSFCHLIKMPQICAGTRSQHIISKTDIKLTTSADWIGTLWHQSNQSFPWLAEWPAKCTLLLCIAADRSYELFLAISTVQPCELSKRTHLFDRSKEQQWLQGTTPQDNAMKWLPIYSLCYDR